MRKWLLISTIVYLNAASAVAIELSEYEIIDLTHAYNEQTIYWPTATRRFELTELANGETDGGWFYSAYAVCTPEHGGTHLDAPIHFSANGHANHEIPLEDLLAPGVVIDVSEAVRRDRNYRLSAADVAAFEAEHGQIAQGTIVLLNTGWSERWPNIESYLGDDTPGDASRLQFPSYGEQAARILVEQRGVSLLGVDTASIDYGPSQEFLVHRVAAARNVAGLENLTNLAQLPATGFTILALPMKIEGGSGGPVRVVALVPRD